MPGGATSLPGFFGELHASLCVPEPPPVTDAPVRFLRNFQRYVSKSFRVRYSFSSTLPATPGLDSDSVPDLGNAPHLCARSF